MKNKKLTFQTELIHGSKLVEHVPKYTKKKGLILLLLIKLQERLIVDALRSFGNQTAVIGVRLQCALNLSSLRFQCVWFMSAESHQMSALRCHVFAHAQG
jgi:hypothetical protein